MPTKTVQLGKSLGKRILDNWQLTCLLAASVILAFVYKYIPMYGIQIAFRGLKASQGYMGSEWGLHHLPGHTGVLIPPGGQGGPWGDWFPRDERRPRSGPGPSAEGPRAFGWAHS